MKNPFFEAIEHQEEATCFPILAVLEHLQFNDQGLIPAIIQDHESSEVLMMAWMNREALNHTLKTGNLCYWSRSRNCLWIKGESSGNTQRLVGLRVDCDGDTLLCSVEQAGPACHTQRRSCFYLCVLDKEVCINTTTAN